MSTEENKALVRRAIEEVWNQGKVALFDELYAPNFLYHNHAASGVRTLEDFKRFVPAFRRAFPDIQTTIQDMVAEGDRVVLRFTFRGTHGGDFMTPTPLAATGKQVTVTGISIGRIVFDKVVEVWDEVDNLSLLQQLGVIPSTGQTS